MKKLLPIFLLSAIAFTFICYSTPAINLAGSAFQDTGLVNLHHLDYLYTPVAFPDSTKAAGVYIYAEAPDYHRIGAEGEGYICVDDVSRAVLVYIRNRNYSTDTAMQTKASNLIRFLLKMQSENGYFYNFLLADNSINRTGQTSVNGPDWWSWRALQALTEAAPFIKGKNENLFNGMDTAIHKLITKIKVDLLIIPATTKVVKGITVPQWLPAGSATDQASVLILALIPYCRAHNDIVLKNYVRKLADGIVLMQAGDMNHYPYNAFLSWENQWHAYGNDQAYALFAAGTFLKDQKYISKALAEVEHLYPWLLKNGFQSSFTLSKKEQQYTAINKKQYEQIAYGIRPMVFAAAEAYSLTGKKKYADIAGQLAAWLFGRNDKGVIMYDTTTGRCYDAIASTTFVNKNSGAESTIEALLTMEKVEQYPAIKAALNKYKNKVATR